MQMDNIVLDHLMQPYMDLVQYLEITKKNKLLFKT